MRRCRQLLHQKEELCYNQHQASPGRSSLSMAMYHRPRYCPPEQRTDKQNAAVQIEINAVYDTIGVVIAVTEQLRSYRKQRCRLGQQGQPYQQIAQQGYHDNKA